MQPAEDEFVALPEAPLRRGRRRFVHSSPFMAIRECGGTCRPRPQESIEIGPRVTTGLVGAGRRKTMIPQQDSTGKNYALCNLQRDISRLAVRQGVSLRRGAGLHGLGNRTVYDQYECLRDHATETGGSAPTGR